MDPSKVLVFKKLLYHSIPLAPRLHQLVLVATVARTVCYTPNIYQLIWPINRVIIFLYVYGIMTWMIHCEFT